ncbi:hypothetical protein [Williamsia sp. CHRR-6]|uniref:hypothetical protein n=1 Tax=Williamsia sp. CHRR-6 TaxID=2835871 RepID=UPI001BD97590|nr:hypothetical protein [Williamsia sp. CHRR-6]MBT0567420.1 hypothetical protein [Williamsia sp. CHRR-6]
MVTVLALLWGRLWGGRIRFEPWVNLIVCEHMRGGFARGGTCVGGVYLTGGAATRRVLQHESVHAEQWARYGLGFMVRYLLEERRHPGAANRFEIEAGLEDGNYRV